MGTAGSMDALAVGKAGLQGWRGKVADAVAAPVSRHSPMSEDQVRALVGAVFFALAVGYVVGTVKELVTRR
jgi:hypothetical protein